jgi:transcriptional regulator with XRE-family HTH domain
VSPLGPEVRRRRKAQKLTLEGLAERAELSVHYLSTIETSKRDPSVSTVMKLAKGLGVSPGELLGARDDLTPEAIEIGKMIDRSSADVRDAVRVLLKAAARRK